MTQNESFPKTFNGALAPMGVRAAVKMLMPLLLKGADPFCAVLREQYRRSRIVRVELTGLGFYVDFDVAEDAPTTSPPSFTGGDADIRIDTPHHPGGCVVYVRGGRLQTLEVFTFDGVWAEESRLVSVESVDSLCPYAERPEALCYGIETDDSRVD